jgi:hypothetical protein
MWPDTVSPVTTDVEKWLEALPEKAIEGELDQLRQEAAELQRRIEVREQALAVKRSFSIEPLQDELQAAIFSRRYSAKPFRGRAAIRKVIEQNPKHQKWTIPEMLAALHERGWTANTHSVQVNLSRMHRDGELGKDGTGVYVVPDKELLASTGEVQE